MQPPKLDGKGQIFHSKFFPLLFPLSLCPYLFCHEVDAGLNAEQEGACILEAFKSGLDMSTQVGNAFSLFSQLCFAAGE